MGVGMWRLGALCLGLLGFLGLLSCSGPRAVPAHFCLSAVHDGLDAYLAARSDEVVDGVLRHELFVVRNYASDEYQMALGSSGDCASNEEVRSFAQIQGLLRDRMQNQTTLPVDASAWCTVTISISHPTSRDNSGLFLALVMSGLRGVSAVTQDTTNYTSVGQPTGSSVTVRAADQCDAVRNVAGSLVRRRSAVGAFHDYYEAVALARRGT